MPTISYVRLQDSAQCAPLVTTTSPTPTQFTDYEKITPCAEVDPTLLGKPAVSSSSNATSPAKGNLTPSSTSSPVPAPTSTTSRASEAPAAGSPSINAGPISNSPNSATPSVTSQTFGGLNKTTNAPTVGTVRKDGLAGGAVAGIAIGMLLAGVLIAGAIFFFLLRRQKRRHTSQAPVNHLPPASYGSQAEKGPLAVAHAVPGSIDNLLPQPASDDDIRGQVSKIRDNIKNHVRTYYHSAPVSTGINEAALRNIATVAGLSPSALIGALFKPLTRPDVLRMIVAWVVLSKTTGGREAGLLPSQLVELSVAISGTASDPCKYIKFFSSSIVADADFLAQATLYSKWKTITAALLQPNSGKGVHDPNRAQTFGTTIAELDSILGVFVQSDTDQQQRHKNLDMILTRSANFAFLLFSQPGSFQFEFASRRGGLVAFPALFQSAGDDGQALSPPRLMFEGESVAI